NLELGEDSAAFFRVYQHDGEHQTALVLLNKGDSGNVVDAGGLLFDAAWRDAMSGTSLQGPNIDVPAHGVRVLITDDVFGNEKFVARLNELQALATAGSAHH
ncbi:MAG: cyclomaltodextrin glucanotransferase, partial [Gammaproteobacteria bacterium]|nr:cyclomaltodextrin glucanotransferase [Gammaproteobacteria bacterium]